jgi:predicted nucleic acid-binding protein
MENLTSQQLFDELQKRLYAIPVEKLTEYLDIIEAEYINRMAANSGFVAIDDFAF